MEILRTLSVAALAVMANSQAITRPEVVMVTSVVDGGTIVVAGHGRLRLAGIEAPRLGRGLTSDAAFARAAKDRLEGIVTRRFVRVELEAAGSRRAYVLLEDGTLVNAVLVREGLAKAAGRAAGPGSNRRAEIQQAEDQARALRRGIWSQPSQRAPAER